MSSEDPQYTRVDGAVVLGALLIDAAVLGAAGTFAVEYWKELTLLGLGGFIALVALHARGATTFTIGK